MNEKNLQEVLKENKQRYREGLENQRKQIKKEQKKEFIIITITSLFIIGLLCSVLINMGNEAEKNCKKKGYTQCEYRIN